MTRNPWNVKHGSSGSSAGTASAVAAGLVAYGIGSETLGSIVSPSHAVRRDRPAADLRPRQPLRVHDALLVARQDRPDWRESVEDCALVLGAIHGADGKDAAAVRPAVPLARHEAAEGVPRRALREHARRSRPEGAEGSRREARAGHAAARRRRAASSTSILDVESGDRVRRHHAGRRERGHRHLGRHVPPGAVRLGGRLPAGPACPHTLDASEMAKVFEKVDCYVGRQDRSRHHQPDRPPDRVHAERLPQERHADRRSPSPANSSAKPTC